MDFDLEAPDAGTFITYGHSFRLLDGYGLPAFVAMVTSDIPAQHYTTRGVDCRRRAGIFRYRNHNRPVESGA
jgi:hypothetical protein